MNLWHNCKPCTDSLSIVKAIIEVPKGSKVKYEIDKETGALRVDRILFSSVQYPENYGFVPRTLCDDGDPIDILVLSQEPFVPLSVVNAKPIGLLKMNDDGAIDHKIIAVHANDPKFEHYQNISELPPHCILEIKNFFESYKTLEKKNVVTQELLGKQESLNLLRIA